MRLGYSRLGLRGRAVLSNRTMRLCDHRRHHLGKTAGIVAAGMLAVFGALHQLGAHASGTSATQLPAPSPTVPASGPPTTDASATPAPATVVPPPASIPPVLLPPPTVELLGDFNFLEPDGSGGSAIRLDPCGGPLVLNYDPTGEGFAAIFDLVRVGQALGEALDHDVVWHVAEQGPLPAGVVIDIGWVPGFAEIAPNDPDALGIGGPEYSGHTIVAGRVQLVAAPTNGLPAPGLGPGEFGTVLAHELGHVIGLDHVNDPTEIMNPSLQPNKDAEYASGDLAGLQRLGGPCQ
ncbi:MAG: hypothetical protein JWR83_231 [Aeromicrobium sp.]|nr:hypothetical protein [Aeromicrobium sp.]